MFSVLAFALSTMSLMIVISSSDCFRIFIFSVTMSDLGLLAALATLAGAGGATVFPEGADDVEGVNGAAFGLNSVLVNFREDLGITSFLNLYYLPI